MKQYSFKELHENAMLHFENLNVDRLYATSDGQYFANQNRAELHANSNKLSVIPISKMEDVLEQTVTETSPADEPVSINDVQEKEPAKKSGGKKK